ncbi:UbiD family decarboxylase domain-containing protein, partial [Acinetobacter baumannii]|uniref:UbiD family decarboxylase domain-containing protein n=1 Tax=Acinetobacter baumannii TaxID=470 RepID=UPI0035BBB2F8
MPEFPGYTGEAKEAIPVIKVKAVTHRTQPIWRTTVGPGEEHVNMAGIPTEASILDMGGARHAGQITQRLRPLGRRRQTTGGTA